MTVPNTLDAIRTKVRRLTARPSTDQITNAQIDEYVNTYYLYDMPESLRLLKLEDTYNFITEPLIEAYTFNNTLATSQGTIPAYISVSDPVYVAGQQAQYFQDPDLFYREWPKVNYIQQFNSGDGTEGPYTGTLTGTPFLRSLNTDTGTYGVDNIVSRLQQVLITANITSSSATLAIDDGNGNLIDPDTGDNLGTIDYATGAISVTFSQAVSSGTAINAQTIPFVASMPRCVMFWQNQFFLRPVPDKAYTVQLKCFRFPTALLDADSAPELQQWWQLLAYGAALKILVDNGDFDNAEKLRPYYQEQLIYVQRRTIKLLTSQRTSTIYSNAGTYPYSNLYPYI